MRNFKYLQKMFFLLVMGFSLSFVCVACDDDDEEPINDADVTFPSQEGNDLVTPLPKNVEAVDLGLPSGLKWATCNVGASSPEEYGNYYAWGETRTKSSYDSDNSTTYGLSTSDLKSRGIIGSDGNLTAAYDAATANWGSDWRMPTLDEMNELIDNCTWEWTTCEGVTGRLVTGFNGNSIFFPAIGFRYGAALGNVGTIGYYWSATSYSDSSFACYLYFYSDDYYWYSYGYRFYGQAVRPVSDGLLSDSEK